MNQYDKKAVYVYAVGASALAAQMGTGALIGRALSKNPSAGWVGALGGIGLALANEMVPRKSLELGPVRTAALAPALVGERPADTLMRPLLGWSSRK